MISFRNQRQGRKHIQFCHCFCCSLNTLNFQSDRITYFAEQIILQCLKLVLCIQNCVFQFFKLRRSISFCIGKGLLADVILRNQILIRIGHFKIIAEYLVIFNLKIFDTGSFSVLLFQFCKPLLSITLGTAQHINSLIKTILNHTAFSDGNRRFLYNCIQNQLINILKAINFILNLTEFFFKKALQNCFDMRKHLKGIAKSNQVSGISRFISNLTQKTF